MAIINARYAKPMPCPVATETIVTMPSYQIILPTTRRKKIQRIFRNNSWQLLQAAGKCIKESSAGICYMIILKGFYYCICKIPGLFLTR
jgi:hypothetical protein